MLQTNSGNVFYLLVLIICLISQSCTSKTGPVWQLVYQNDFNGNTLYGSRKVLSDALSTGAPIRVSWGVKMKDGSTCIEFAQPDFTTLINDSSVVVQFPMSLIQTDYLDGRKARLRTSGPIGWRALMSTEGIYHQFHYDFTSQQLRRIMYARTSISWFALLPDRHARPQRPLATADTWILDSSVTFPVPAIVPR
jgi:hypothetical protein